MGRDLETEDPTVLAKLLDVMEGGHKPWSHDELQQVLVHQLNAPLLFDLAGVAGGRTSDSPNQERRNPPSSFGELFCHPQPPKRLLQLVKEFAKTSDQRKNSPLPPEISTVLYYAAIIAARLRLNERISALSDESLKKGIGWALEQPWLGPIRPLFAEGLTCVEGSNRSQR